MLYIFQVVCASPSADFATSGKWDFRIRNQKTSEETVEAFDAVLICTGHHAEKHLPKFEGDDVFKGQLIHTCDFHDGSAYSDKRAVIIGIGNSGGDVAVELSRICSQVCLLIGISFLQARAGNQGGARPRGQISSLPPKSNKHHI